MQHEIIVPFSKPMCRKCGMSAPWIDENPCFLDREYGDDRRAERKALKAFENGK